MAVYYVSPSGNDSWGGQGPDASNASTTLRPWLTIGKALGASGIASGDTVYLAPGTYREQVTVAMTSAVAETCIYGDPRNTKGFKDGSGVLLRAGTVIHTAYTADNRTLPANGATLALAGRDYLTFQDILFVAAQSYCLDISSQTSTNLTFRRCGLLGNGNSPLYAIIAFGVQAHWLFDQCALFAISGNHGLALNGVGSASGADYDLDIIVRNSIFVGFGASTSGIRLAGSSSTYKPGGVLVRGCDFVGWTNALSTVTGTSTTYPCRLDGCRVFGTTAANAQASNQIIEDYNLICCASPRSNTAIGPNSMVMDAAAHAYSALMMHLGIGQLWGMQPRPFLMPMSGSPMLGWGSYTGAPTTDFLGRIRPAGAGDTKSSTDTGTATAGAASILTDSGKSWTTNAWTGYVVTLTGGTGSGQKRYIISNTGTVLTVEQPWATNPDNTTTYSIATGATLPAVGAYERHDTAVKQSSVYDAGAALSMTGPSDQDIYIPVDAASTTISIKARYASASYGGTNYPQAILLDASEIGVSTETKTATSGASDAWETLTFSAFTPTAKGVVRIRLVNRTNNGAGVCYWDTLAVA